MVGSSCPICPRVPAPVFGTNLNVLNSEPDHWYVKAGLRERWSSLGHTVLYGFYGQRNDMIGAGSLWPLTTSLAATTRQYGAWVSVQEIDAAAMSVWLQYDHLTADVPAVRCGGDDV